MLRLRRFYFIAAFAGLLLLAPDYGRANPAVTPVSVIRLFDGKTLDSFETWEIAHQHDNPDRVFSVVECIDGAPAIRISGEHYGGLITRERFKDYRLAADFRWGLLTWGIRRAKARDSGILVHCQGEAGSFMPDFKSPWMRSIEYQIIEGGTGDMIVVPGCDQRGGPRIFPTLRVTADGPAVMSPQNAPVANWKPDGVPVEISRGRVNWEHRDPHWEDLLGYRGPRDIENPVGRWNHIEIECRGERVTYFLNGKKVNEAESCSMSEGRLLFQSEGAEIFFRGIVLRPLSVPAPSSP